MENCCLTNPSILLPCEHSICDNCAKTFLKQKRKLPDETFACLIENCEKREHRIGDLVANERLGVVYVELFKEFVTQPRLIEDRLMALSFWLEYSETEIEIRVESLKIQIDIQRDKFVEIVDKVEKELLSLSETRKMYQCEKLFTFLAARYRRIEMNQIGTIYNYKPRHVSVKEAIKSDDLEDFEYYYELDKISDDGYSKRKSLLEDVVRSNALNILNLVSKLHIDDYSEIIPFEKVNHGESYDRELKFLLRRGADINVKNASGYDALMRACSRRHTDCETAEILLNAGACVNTSHEALGGMTPLLMACTRSNRWIVEWLVRSGVDLNAKRLEDGWTALMLSVFHGFSDLVQILLIAGADLNVRNNSGSTALIVAIIGIEYSTNHLLIHLTNKKYNKKAIARDIVHLLIEKGADVTVRNNDGLTAYEIACSKGYEEITALFDN